jgi:phage tail-like protein
MIEETRKNTNPGFRFTVNIDSVVHGVFTECTLPSIEIGVDPVKEGGLNNYIHELPTRREKARLTLKNGVGTSKLMDWYKDIMEGKFKRNNITVELLNAKDKTSAPIMTWSIENALPIKWTGPTLKTDDNSIAIQTLEFICGNVTMS